MHLSVPKTLYFPQVNMLCTWIKTGMSASIPDTKPFGPWNIHHKYPCVHSVGWMLKEENEEVAFWSFPLMGANRVSLRVIACGRGKSQLEHSSYSQALPLGGYLYCTWSTTPKDDPLHFLIWLPWLGVKTVFLAVLVPYYRAIAYRFT